MIFWAELHSATEFCADLGGAAALLDQLLGLLRRSGRQAFAGQRGTDVVDDHFGPGRRHGKRDLAPDAAARAGHRHDLAFHHASHQMLSSVRPFTTGG